MALRVEKMPRMNIDTFRQPRRDRGQDLSPALIRHRARDCADELSGGIRHWLATLPLGPWGWSVVLGSWAGRQQSAVTSPTFPTLSQGPHASGLQQPTGARPSKPSSTPYCDGKTCCQAPALHHPGSHISSGSLPGRAALPSILLLERCPRTQAGKVPSNGHRPDPCPEPHGR